MNNKRIVTFVVEFEQENAPKYLWDLHLKPKDGVRVISIAEGNIIEKLENKYMDEAEDSL